jgi:hypothetical protein
LNKPKTLFNAKSKGLAVIINMSLI